MTVLGGATSSLIILTQGLPFFVGCMENVVVNGNWVIPSAPNSSAGSAASSLSNILHLTGTAVEMGCPRVDHCRPNPCHNQGLCNDLWTFFNCSCQQPYIGDTCQFSKSFNYIKSLEVQLKSLQVQLKPLEVQLKLHKLYIYIFSLRLHCCYVWPREFVQQFGFCVNYASRAISFVQLYGYLHVRPN